MLKCINPNEAQYFDPAAGIHIKFRLAGVIKLHISSQRLQLQMTRTLLFVRLFAWIWSWKFVGFIRRSFHPIYTTRYSRTAQCRTCAPTAPRTTRRRTPSAASTATSTTKETECPSVRVFQLCFVLMYMYWYVDVVSGDVMHVINFDWVLFPRPCLLSKKAHLFNLLCCCFNVWKRCREQRGLVWAHWEQRLATRLRPSHSPHHVRRCHVGLVPDQNEVPSQQGKLLD